MTLEFVGVSHRFGRRRALADLSLAVAPGSCWGFLGPNGAGKTTALRIALGLMRPTSGRVLVEGLDACRDGRAVRQLCGGLIEHPGFQRDLDGRGNLSVLARLQGLARRDARREADRVLDRVGLATVGDRRVGHYSLGMRQRLGIAQALIGDPPYLLLDEPLSGLDPEGLTELRDLLRDLAGGGRAILLSTHQLHDVQGLCSHVAILRSGRLLVAAATDELLADPRHRYRIVSRDPDAARQVLAELGLRPRPAAAAAALECELAELDPVPVLQSLIARGVAVSAFAPVPADLGEIYMRWARAAGDDPPPSPAAPEHPRRRNVASVGVLTAAWRCARYESGRIWLRPRALLLALPAVAGAYRAAARRAEDAADLRRVADGELFSTTAATAFDATAHALLAAAPLLALVAVAGASQSIAGEFGRGTLRHLLLRPLGRAPLLLGKSLAHAVAATVAWLAAVAASLGVAAIWFTFGDVEEVMRGGVRTPLLGAEDLWPQMWTALLGPVPVLLGYVGVGVLLSVVFRSGVQALAAAVAAAIGLEALRDVVAERWLLATYLPSPIRDTSALRAFADLTLGRADAFFPHAATAGWVPAAWLAATVLGAVILFSRRSVP